MFTVRFSPSVPFTARIEPAVVAGVDAAVELVGARSLAQAEEARDRCRRGVDAGHREVDRRHARRLLHPRGARRLELGDGADGGAVHGVGAGVEVVGTRRDLDGGGRPVQLAGPEADVASAPPSWITAVTGSSSTAVSRTVKRLVRVGRALGGAAVVVGRGSGPSVQPSFTA